MPIRRVPELIELDGAKSMIRALPPNGTAGVARSSVDSIRREPQPPAEMKTMLSRAIWLVDGPLNHGLPYA